MKVDLGEVWFDLVCPVRIGSDFVWFRLSRFGLDELGQVGLRSAGCHVGVGWQTPLHQQHERPAQEVWLQHIIMS